MDSLRKSNSTSWRVYPKYISKTRLTLEEIEKYLISMYGDKKEYLFKEEPNFKIIKNEMSKTSYSIR
jgi:hypothetical protein